MGLNYGPKAYKVTSIDVNLITLNTTSIDTAQTGDIGPGGTYQLFVNHLNAGCDYSEVNLQLKDNISWKYITFEMVTTGPSACWGWNSGGYSNAGNMESYDEAKGDRLFECINTWEQAQFQTHNRTQACDNDANNFMRYNTSGPRIFCMKRRRNIGAGLVTISHGRACNTYGTTLIRKISLL
jgi:hypothetical protein